MSEESIQKRSRATSDLTNTEKLSTEEFFKQNFSHVVEKGRLAATVMSEILSGYLVRRYYFLSSSTPQNRPPTTEIEITEITVGEAGIVRVYDKEGMVREFPALSFDFQYRQDGKAVFCIGQDYSVLFEQIAPGDNSIIPDFS